MRVARLKCVPGCLYDVRDEIKRCNEQNVVNLYSNAIVAVDRTEKYKFDAMTERRICRMLTDGSNSLIFKN